MAEWLWHTVLDSAATFIAVVLLCLGIAVKIHTMRRDRDG